MRELSKTVSAFQKTPADTFFKNEELDALTAELLTAIDAAIGFCEQRSEKMALITLESTVKGMRQQLEFNLSADALTNS